LDEAHNNFGVLETRGRGGMKVHIYGPALMS